MGLLDRIGAFDRYKVSPTQGTSGLLTGAGRPMSPFAQQAARNIGGLLGMDMRTPGEVAAQTMSQIGQDDPERLRKIVEIQLQAAVRAGDTTNAAKYANVLENIKAQEADKAKLATPKVVGSQTQYLRDSKGNNYARVMAVDEKGVATFEIQPLGDAPEKPVGKLSPTEGGFTMQEQVELARQEAEAQAYGAEAGKQFAQTEESILGAGLAAANELPQLDQVLDIVNAPDFNSGKLSALLSRGKQILGVETADIGRFNKATADILLKALDNFKGAISEGERAYLIQNLANLEQSTDINRALIQDARDILERARQRAEYYSDQKAKGKKWDSVSWFNYVNEDYKQGYKGRPEDIVASDTGEQPNNAASSEDPQNAWDAFQQSRSGGQMNKRRRGN
tara:strand:+ start:445 stop:1626 length:1182 start_codon:yes stop_codon:yes gene_type:complete